MKIHFSNSYPSKSDLRDFYELEFDYCCVCTLKVFNVRKGSFGIILSKNKPTEAECYRLFDRKIPVKYPAKLHLKLISL